MSFLGARVLSAIAAVGFGCLAASSANAATFAQAWTGANQFNNAEINFAPITATSMTIAGPGSYEGCCFFPVPTGFLLELQWGSAWHAVGAWAVLGQDEAPKLLSGLGSISFGLHAITGLRLLSAPPGLPFPTDRNYTSLLGTTFNFDGPNAAPGETPLPAALPLMATILGGAGLAAWRRRRNQAKA
jgi:hypothetical protein